MGDILGTRYLGAARLAVPSIGLGCMALSGLYGTPEASGSLRLLDRALELGCTFLDTSDAYLVRGVCPDRPRLPGRPVQ